MGEVRRIDSLEGREGGRGGGKFLELVGFGQKKEIIEWFSVND